MITFLGDVALLNKSIQSRYNPKGDYVFNFEYVTSGLDGITSFVPTKNKINLYSDNHNIEKIWGHNPVAVSVANNHIFDYGLNGYNATIDVIKNQSIVALGETGYFNQEVAIFAYTLFGGVLDGKNYFQFNKEKCIEDINLAKSKGASSIIVNIHWGIENHPSINSEQKTLGHWLIDNGVDLVVGHHPHCIQPIEKYKDRYIFYSLGNCLFPNFSIPCFFNQEGISTRVYRFKWQSWNNKSLALIFDEKTNQLVQVDELVFKNNILNLNQQNIKIEKYNIDNHRFKFLDNIIYSIRKYWLFLRSNMFVDGKLFDFQALMSEFKK